MNHVVTQTFMVDGQLLTAEECRKLFGGIELGERQRQVLDLVEGQRLVDIGCYAGSFVAAVKARHPEMSVMGVDYFADHVGIARVVFPELADHFMQMSIYELKLEDGSVDCVTLQEVLEHLEGAAHAVKEINRVLSDGGVAIVSVPNPFYLSGMLGFFRFEIRNRLRALFNAKPRLGTEVYFSEIEWNRHIFAWTPQTLLTLFAVNGFAYVEHRYEYAGNIAERLLMKLFPFFGPTQILKVRKVALAPEKLV
jgi:ubiquinone/menaquinone biosynthesis C-methylase UbiE